MEQPHCHSDIRGLANGYCPESASINQSVKPALKKAKVLILPPYLMAAYRSEAPKTKRPSVFGNRRRKGSYQQIT
jgi:hypothetical protein